MLAYWSSSVNDVPFGLASIHYSNLGMTMFMPLTKLSPVISRPCIGLLCWFGLSMGLCFTQSLCPWSGWIFLRLYPVLCFRWIYLWFIIHLFFLSRSTISIYHHIILHNDITNIMCMHVKVYPVHCHRRDPPPPLPSTHTHIKKKKKKRAKDNILWDNLTRETVASMIALRQIKQESQERWNLSMWIYKKPTKASLFLG